MVQERISRDKLARYKKTYGTGPQWTRSSRAGVIERLHRSVNPLDYGSSTADALHADLYRYAASEYLVRTGRPFQSPQSAHTAVHSRCSLAGSGRVVEAIVGYAAELASPDVDLLTRAGDLTCGTSTIEVKSSWVDRSSRGGRGQHQVKIPVKQFAESDLFVLSLLTCNGPENLLNVDWYVVPSDKMAEHVAEYHYQPSNPGQVSVSFGAAAREELSRYQMQSFTDLSACLQQVCGNEPNIGPA